MYCDWNDEYVEITDCDGCERGGNCSQLDKIEKAARLRSEKISRLKNEETYKTIMSVFTKYTGIETAEAEIMTDAMFVRAMDLAESDLDKHLLYFAEKQALEYFEKLTDKSLDAAFEKVMAEKVLLMSSDNKTNIATIANVVNERVAKYFNSKDSSKGRDHAAKTMQAAITKVVESKVEESLKEITEEAIEKFNKETMKTMMMGMAKAIQDNPKLLTILNATAKE